MTAAVWLREAADGSVVLTLHIQPGAKKTEFVGLHGEALKIRLAAPPVDGKANAALCAFLADFCGVPKSAVSLVSGETSRAKRVRIDGASAGALARLRALG
ncbi:MAG: uncharacterized protein AzoDbin1_03482 [Azoarcus sp.]|uniref:UPF0235 protein SAMN05421829_111143 n=1 Tax=Aromatoleum tolulyticum TaxID=34027 RepID=A0A1N6Z8K7_9RHOO|nr:DUF167 family protein [Aromatoleum tolulyticum]MCK9987010.1 uncharacterized protein [Azoarcus sp.]SIR23119.1 hypothetical protein SAMN05421829_111143 [Aromatoleum tolulyticum]